MSTCRRGARTEPRPDDRAHALYLVLLFMLVWLGIVRFNLFWKASPFIVLLLLNIGLFIPMGWGAPQGPALVVRNAVVDRPDVAGEVIEVPVDGQHAAEGGRYAVQDRSRCPTRRKSRRSRRS